jgi:phenylalanyl-tRNA synthetase beta chain
MKVPLSWLCEHLTWNQDTDALVVGLTGLGLEVEQVHSMPALDKRLCVVHVAAIEPHPNSETLQLVTIYDGKQKVTVVCGAPNVFVGQLTIYAPPQTKLAGITVTERKVRGVMSPGMLCSEKDCGIGMDHGGLVSVDENIKPGTTLTEILPAQDTVLELGITPNRGDCLSIRGIARELAALTQQTLLPVAVPVLYPSMAYLGNSIK